MRIRDYTLLAIRRLPFACRSGQSFGNKAAQYVAAPLPLGLQGRIGAHNLGIEQEACRLTRGRPPELTYLDVAAPW
jgi:hypothetical protein